MSAKKFVWCSKWWLLYGVVKLEKIGRDYFWVEQPTRRDGYRGYQKPGDKADTYQAGSREVCVFETREEAVEDAEMRRDQRVLATRRTLRRLQKLTF